MQQRPNHHLLVLISDIEMGLVAYSHPPHRDLAIDLVFNGVYAEVYLAKGRAVRSHLVEVDGPAPPPGHVPRSLLELRERVLPLLDPADERAQIDRAQREQLDREARGE